MSTAATTTAAASNAKKPVALEVPPKPASPLPSHVLIGPSSALFHLTNAHTEGKPFVETWLNSLYLQTLLPNSPWNEVADKLCSHLANSCRRQFNVDERKQIIFSLLGDDFVKKYFPEELIDPDVISPPRMSWDKRRELQHEAQSWLHIHMTLACEETGCMREIIAKETGKPQSNEMTGFLQHVHSTVEQAVEDEAMKQEMEHRRKMHLRALQRKSQSITEESPTLSELDLLKDPDVVMASLPFYSSSHSEQYAKNVVTILRRDPSRTASVMQTMMGRRLPQKMRQFIWTHVLLDPERNYFDENKLELHVRERFAKGISRGVTELKIPRATKSPIHNLVQTAVLEAYEKTLSMGPFNTSEFLSESIRALNVLYTYNRVFDPHLILWLFPLQLAYFNEDKRNDFDQAPHVYDLAMYLSQLSSGKVFPSWSTLFVMAQETIHMLSAADESLVNHLQNIAKINNSSKSKDFLVHIIQVEKEMAKSNEDGKQISPIDTQSLLADPVIYIRKWIGEGFVSAVSHNALLFIWDQMMMEKFSPASIEDMALALILLLRQDFLNAKDHGSMKQVFLTMGQDLFTVDVIRAWVWLHKGGDPKIVPSFNRRLSLRPTEPEIEMISAPPTPKKRVILPSLALNEINLTLKLSKAKADQIKWLAKFTPERIVVYLQMNFNGVILHEIKTKTSPKLIKLEEDKVKNVYYLAFVNEVPLFFEDIDIGGFDIGLELSEVPNLVAKICYEENNNEKRGTKKILDVDDITDNGLLGWGTIPVYQFNENPTLNNQPTGQSEPSPASQQQKQQNDSQKTPPIQILNKNADGRKKPSPQTTTNKNKVITPTPLSEVRGANQQPKQVQRKKINPRDLHPNLTPIYQRIQQPLYLPPIPDSDEDFDPPTVNDPEDFLLLDSMIGVHLYDADKPPSPPPEIAPIVPVEAVKQPKADEEIQPTENEVPKEPLEEGPQQPLTAPWVPFNPAATAKDPPPVKSNEPFCLYLDQLRFMPDESTVFKVTGRLLKSGSDHKFADISLLADLITDPRSPTFRGSQRIIFNRTTPVLLDSNTILLLRVYTLHKRTLELCVIGNCIVRIFNDAGELCVGGYQKRLYNQLPDVGGLAGVDGMDENSLDDFAYIPCATITFRLLPFAVKPHPTPLYHSGYYRSQKSEPTEYELKIYEIYQNDKDYPTDFRVIVRYLKRREGFRDFDNTAVTQIFMMQYVPPRLDASIVLPPNTAPKHLRENLAFVYRKEKGIKIRVNGVYGLSDNKMYFVVCRIMRSRLSRDLEPNRYYGYGLDDDIVFFRLNPNSTFISPKFNQNSIVTRPYKDEQALLIVQVFGLDVIYTAGEFKTINGTAFGKLAKNHMIGWTAIRLFDYDFTNAARYTLPLFNSPLRTTVFTKFQTKLIHEVLDAEPNEVTTDGDVVQLDVIDGHEESDENIIYSLSEDKSLLDKFPSKLTLFQENLSRQDGKQIKELIINGIPDNVKMFGSDSAAFAEEEIKFHDAYEAFVKKILTEVKRYRPHMPLFA